MTVPGDDLRSHQQAMISALEGDSEQMRAAYNANAAKVSAYFNAWFEGV